MKEEKILRKVLEDNHYKVTRPRLLVFHLLFEQPPQPMTALIQQSQGQIDRVSVYRIIDLFEQLGIVRRVMIGWKYKVELSEIFLDHHHHIVCLGCGKIAAVKENAAVEAAINALADNGFLILSHQLELQGYCEQCQKRRKE